MARNADGKDNIKSTARRAAILAATLQSPLTAAALERIRRLWSVAERAADSRTEEPASAVSLRCQRWIGDHGKYQRRHDPRHFLQLSLQHQRRYLRAFLWSIPISAISHRASTAECVHWGLEYSDLALIPVNVYRDTDGIDVPN